MRVNQMPRASTPGFRYVGGVDFRTNARAGAVARPQGDRTRTVYGRWLLPYGNWSGTHGGQYRFQENVSVHGGVLDARFRTINGRNTGSAWIWKHPRATFRDYGFKYGAVEQRVKVVGGARGYGAANILWPDSERWGDGEIDFPEGEFSGKTYAYHHCLGSKRAATNCSAFKTR